MTYINCHLVVNYYLSVLVQGGFLWLWRAGFTIYHFYCSPRGSDWFYGVRLFFRRFLASGCLHNRYLISCETADGKTIYTHSPVCRLSYSGTSIFFFLFNAYMFQPVGVMTDLDCLLHYMS